MQTGEAGMKAGAVRARNGDVLLAIGTTKGVFLLQAAGSRRRWRRSGPRFPGQSVYALAYDGRGGRTRLLAGVQSSHWGSLVATSDDFGKTWREPKSATLRFPDDTKTALRQIWQLVPGRPDEPDTLWAGVEPAALFRSDDGGRSWSLVRGLFDHPHRPRWTPGFGGLCLHTVLPDPRRPERLHVAISTGGVYRSDDGGATWQARNRGIRTPFLPTKFPEFGQCVHKMVRHPSKPDRLFLQHHWGVYRSDDRGDTWKNVGRALPSDFGFAMGIHPRDPDTVYVLPLTSDGFRCAPGGKLRVYVTRNAGKTWKPLSKGLPQKGAFETVLRDALALDSLDPAGIYFGTRSGKLFGSRDEGRSWDLLADGLPPITCVRAAVAGV
jgi:photosystem II stability/assembly factor-like uncharacterized protein